MSARKVLCGFCHKGGEESSTSGRLYSHESIHAHLRCMQYSSGLAQYQKGRYPQLGGFKWSQVKDEMKRGSHLKCHVCGKRKGAVRGATAGCTIKKCPKTFHFTCAALDKTAVTKRIVVHSPGEDEKVFYRVFCSKSHFQIYEKQELKKLGAFEYQSDSDEDDEDEDNDSGTSDPQSSSKDTVARRKDTLSIVGAIYPRIANISQDIDAQSEDNEVVFNPNSMLVTADVHSEPNSSLSQVSTSTSPQIRRSPRSPEVSPVLPKPPQKTRRSLSPWGTIGCGIDEIIALADNSIAQDESLGDSNDGPGFAVLRSPAAKRKQLKELKGAVSDMKVTSSSSKAPCKTRQSNSNGNPNFDRSSSSSLSLKSLKSHENCITSNSPKVKETVGEQINSSKDQNSSSSPLGVATRKATKSPSSVEKRVSLGSKKKNVINHQHVDDKKFDEVKKKLSFPGVHIHRRKHGCAFKKSLKMGNLRISLTDCLKNDSPRRRSLRQLEGSPKSPSTKFGSDAMIYGSPPSKRLKQHSHEGDGSGSAKSSPKILKSEKPKPEATSPCKTVLRTKAKKPLHTSTPKVDVQTDRNESFDLTPNSSLSHSVSGENISDGPSPVAVGTQQHLQRSPMSKMSSRSDTSASSPGRSKHHRKAARKSQQKWRTGLDSPKRKQQLNDQATEDAEIRALLKCLPAWQAWLQQKGSADAQPLRAVCFLETPLPSNHVLHRAILRSFGINEQDIFTWQPPDSLQLSQQHMLHIIKDISAHLQAGEINEVQRIMLKLDECDIQKYTKQIEFDEKYIYTDQEARQKIQSKIWNAVRDCLQEGCDKTGIIGGILNISDINVLVLLLNSTLDSLGDIYKSMLNSQMHKVSLFNFGENTFDWTVNLRPRHTQEMYMEEEQTTICRWLLARVDSCCEISVQPADEVLRQSQLSVNSYLMEHLPRRLPGSGTAKPTTMVILVGPVNLDVVNISAYCLFLIPYLLDRYSDVPHLYLVIDLGELEGTVIRAALIPDQLPDDVIHHVWMAADPKVLPVSCLILQLTRKSRLPLAASSS